MIRKSLLLAVAVVMVTGSAWAQRPAIELNFYSDYVWTTSISASVPTSGGGFRNGDFDIKSNPTFGFAVDVEVRPGTQIEFFYQRQDSEVEFKDAVTRQKETLWEIATSYYQIGALQGFRRGKWLPFTGGALGATSFDPQGTGQDTEWKFSFTFQAGAKVYLSERIALRFHGRLLASLLESGAGLWFGTGGVSVTLGGSALWQWGLGGGLVILL
jgi:opacity protein-like surface antigen